MDSLLRTLDARQSRRALMLRSVGFAGAAAAVSAGGFTARAVAQGTPAPDGIDYPSGADDIVIRVQNIGGFVMPEFSLRALPLVQVNGDGSIFTQGPQIMIYPPPALPNVQMGQLTPEGIESLLRAASDAGVLDGDQTYESMFVADAPTTVITVTAEGRTTVVSAYALGFDLPEDAPPAEREALARLQTFVGQLTEPLEFRPESEVAMLADFAELDRWQVVFLPYDEAIAEEGFDQEPVDWPLATPIAEIGTPLAEADGGENYAGIFPDARVAVLEGDDLDNLLAIAEPTHELTPWISDGDRYQLVLRPVLPGETAPLARAPETDLNATPAAVATPMG